MKKCLDAKQEERTNTYKDDGEDVEGRESKRIKTLAGMEDIPASLFGA